MTSPFTHILVFLSIPEIVFISRARAYFNLCNYRLQE
jgi:hypothetical protein